MSMKKLVFDIDASLFTSRREAHEVMKKVFCDFEYYGNNLDALHDVLTSIMKDSTINIRNLDASKEYIGMYADRIKIVFCESAKENPHLTLVFSEMHELDCDGIRYTDLDD